MSPPSPQVLCMKWSPDGQRICIIYEDGAVIVGDVDGNRPRERPRERRQPSTGSRVAGIVQWSPDSRLLLFVFCTPQCEVSIYDAMGNYISKMNLYGAATATELVGIDWYDGAEGYSDPGQPTLALGMENGWLQLQWHETDENPILIDTDMVRRMHAYFRHAHGGVSLTSHVGAGMHTACVNWIGICTA